MDFSVPYLEETLCQILFILAGGVRQEKKCKIENCTFVSIISNIDTQFTSCNQNLRDPCQKYLISPRLTG